jgi:hypothetical protein
MDYLSVTELKTHLYEEIANEITRSDDAIIEDAIEAAVDELKGYIAKYDLAQIFTYTIGEPFDTKELWLAARNRKLLSVAKDVATWHLIRLCNPNIELLLRRTLYEDAVSWLKGVQSGKIDPLLPVPIPSEIALGNAGTQDGPIKWESNYKRNNHF